MWRSYLYGEIRYIRRFPFNGGLLYWKVFLYGEVIYLERFVVLGDFVIPEVYYTAKLFSYHWEVP